MDPVTIAQKVLELSEDDDFEGILNLAATSAATMIEKSSPVNLLRKYYLKLSLIIHPDKLGKSFKESTKAFQGLVRAFESLTAPEVIEEQPTKGKGKGKKDSNVMQISRSNHNCFRTRILCPRCKQPWNENSLDGNPDYCYNFLMTGLKQYLCSTCLCEFGCMTAIHLCPHCKKRFEYDPKNYHEQVTCPNERCKKKFGFFLYHVSDRVIKDLKEQVKADLERKLKIREQKQRRAARSKRSLTTEELEKSFLMGLHDVCPRCGLDFSSNFDENEVRQHLMDCNDEMKHKEFAEKKDKEEAKKTTKAAKKQKQEAVATEAAFQLLGSSNAQLWILDEEQLRNEAQRRGVKSTGSKDELIDRLVGDDNDDEHHSSIKYIEGGAEMKGPSSALVVRKKRKRTISAEELPSNLHSLDEAQIRSILISHGLKSLITPKATKEDLLTIIEGEVFEGKDA